MLKMCTDMKRKFLDKFDYFPATPFEVIKQDREASEEYCKLLQKCIDDNFDYTIELYGTIPRKSEGLPRIIID